ncbi:MAG TPA: NAD-dependent epimerase/dehydratase family protein [Phycisphaerae bacterium]|nr:NAD-dependent epimerase/dehydratase family protein [Phycisphaerae bacterium]
MNCLVTGGGGFLGLAVVKQLCSRGHTVRTFQRGKYAELDALGVESIQGDITDAAAIAAAAKGVDTVFHVAAKPGVWGTYADFHSPNVIGTQNVLSACRSNSIPRLIFTSSPSVVFGGNNENGITESAPYARRYLAHYPKTKAIAEQLVLAANSVELATIALRPHLIWGPNDPHLVPRILERARIGRLSMIGNRKNLVDSTYIDNAANAHLLAADRLAPGSPISGKAYFISNGEPLPMADLIRRILSAAGIEPVIPTLNSHLAYAAGTAMELTHKLLRLKHEPLLTRFVARQLSTAHWFDISAAKRDLGYEPQVTIEEGMQRLAKSLRETPLEIRR